jgi:chloramphenicol 3-O-phosphotransferase
MQLIFLHGAPGVGKLTVARELARLTGFKLFHNHLTVDLVGAVFPFGTEPFVLLREEIWLATFRQAAKNETSLIFTFAPEGTVRSEFIPETISAVESRGGKVVFVELTCGEEELERRLEDPSRSKFGKLQSIEQYRELKKSGAFDFPRIVSGLSVETTATEPKLIARTIADYLSA